MIVVAAVVRWSLFPVGKIFQSMLLSGHERFEPFADAMSIETRTTRKRISVIYLNKFVCIDNNNYIRVKNCTKSMNRCNYN